MISMRRTSLDFLFTNKFAATRRVEDVWPAHDALSAPGVDLEPGRVNFGRSPGNGVVRGLDVGSGTIGGWPPARFLGRRGAGARPPLAGAASSGLDGRQRASSVQANLADTGAAR
jgi:hypothetical protein